MQALLGMPWVRKEGSLGLEGRKKRRGKEHEERGRKESPRATQPLGGRGRQRARELKRSLPVQVRVCVPYERVYPRKEEVKEVCSLPGRPEERRAPSGPSGPGHPGGCRCGSENLEGGGKAGGRRCKGLFPWP